MAKLKSTDLVVMRKHLEAIESANALDVEDLKGATVSLIQNSNPGAKQAPPVQVWVPATDAFFQALVDYVVAAGDTKATAAADALASMGVPASAIPVKKAAPAGGPKV